MYNLFLLFSRLTKMSKRKTTGINLNASTSKRSKNDPPTLAPSSANVRSTWTGGVEMHATKDDKTTLLDEAEDEQLNEALSSDDEDDKYVLTKSGKVKKKSHLKAKKFGDDFETTLEDETSEERIKLDRNLGEEEMNMKSSDKKDSKFLDKDQEFTAFNLKEEKSDLGKFNEKTGDFEFEKDPNERADNWLADVKWNDIDNLAEEKLKKYKEKFKNDHEIYNSDGKISYSKSDVIENLEKIVKFLLPHESVSVALKRMRPKRNSGSRNKQNLKRKVDRQSKYGDASTDENADSEKAAADKIASELEQNKKDLTILSDLANNVAGSGYYEVYHNSISQLEDYITELKTEIGQNTNVAKDDLDDMFGDSDDEKENNQPDTNSSAQPKQTLWEYKWGEETENNELFGPFDTQSMTAWKEAGYFTGTEKTTFCRRVGTISFYDANRTDFDLYD